MVAEEARGLKQRSWDAHAKLRETHESSVALLRSEAQKACNLHLATLRRAGEEQQRRLSVQLRKVTAVRDAVATRVAQSEATADMVQKLDTLERKAKAEAVLATGAKRRKAKAEAVLATG